MMTTIDGPLTRRLQTPFAVRLGDIPIPKFTRPRVPDPLNPTTTHDDDHEYDYIIEPESILPSTSLFEFGLSQPVVLDAQITKKVAKSSLRGGSFCELPGRAVPWGGEDGTRWICHAD